MALRPASRRPWFSIAASVVACVGGVHCALFTDFGGFTDGATGAAKPDASVTGDGTLADTDALATGGIELVDDDAADFGAGVFDATSFEQGRVGLAGVAATGRFTSRVHDARRQVEIASLRWVPGAPYGKALPDLADKEGPYRHGALDMRDNVLLLHFNGPAGALASQVTDESGGANGMVVMGEQELVIDGVFGAALRDGLSSYVAAPMAAASALNIGVSDATWAYWVRSTQDCPIANPPSGNRVHMGYEEPANDKTHVWLGCLSTASTACENPDGTGRAGGTWCGRKVPTSDCRGICGRTTINDGKWHHVALVKRGHATGILRLFVDGKADAPDTSTAFETPIAIEAGGEMGIGAFTKGTFAAAGDFDEVAVWRRALLDEEIASMFLRGALALSLGVRVCTQPDCSDAPPFEGPGPSVLFTDPAGPGPPGPAPLARPLRGQYFQYESRLRSFARDATPELFEVRLLGKAL